jgi:hypothetical protein
MRSTRPIDPPHESHAHASVNQGVAITTVLSKQLLTLVEKTQKIYFVKEFALIEFTVYLQCKNTHTTNMYHTHVHTHVSPHRPRLVVSLAHVLRPVIIAESQPALKVSFNRPRPRSQPARANPKPGVCVGCLFFFTAVRTVVINVFFKD